jgi:hypothetical protein
VNTAFGSSRLVLLVLLASTVLGLAACSAGSSSTAQPATLRRIRDATFAAGSARYQGQVRFADATRAALVGVAAADPAAGDVTMPVQTATGVQDGELSWVDGTLYIKRVAGTAPPGATALAGALLRSETDRPWVRLPVAGIAQALLGPYDPFALLDQLSAPTATVAFREDGSESVAGRDLDRFVVEAEGDGSGLAVGIRRVELLTDRDHRLVLARLTGDQAIEYTLSDYGTVVSVAAPPDDQIAAPVVGERGESPTGTYQKVATGTFDGLVWQLVSAPATGNGSCWRFDIQGDQSAPVAATESDGATCLAGLDPTVDEPVQIVVDSGSAAPFDAIAAVVPSGSQAVLRFADRSSQPVAVDPRGFVVWVGPKDPMLVVLDVTLPDGRPEACGPGSVSSLDDLDTLDPASLTALRDAPWLCIPG